VNNRDEVEEFAATTGAELTGVASSKQAQARSE
jgi:hypothetical protein